MMFFHQLSYHFIVVAVLCASPVASALDMTDKSVTLGLSVVAAATAFRDEDEDEDEDGDGDGDGDGDADADVVPFVEVEIGRFVFYPLGLSATLWEWELIPSADQPSIESPWNLGVYAGIELGLDKREQDDMSIFSGMQDRGDDSLIMIGADWVTPVGLFTLLIGSDIGDTYGGFGAELGWGVPLFDIGPVGTWLGLGVLVQNEELIDHLYGVRVDKAIDGRPAYTPEAAATPYLDLGAGTTFGRGWELSAQLLIEQIPKEILRSLTSDKRKRYRAFVWLVNVKAMGGGGTE